MLKKTVLAGLLIFIFSNFTGIVYGKGKTTGYLQVIYKSFECGLSNPHIYSCYAPFYMKGNKIIGKFEIPEDGKIHLPLVPMVPYDRDKFFKKQIINYSYNCPPGGHGCPPTVVSGNVVVHKVSGEVIKIKGKKMLHFVVRVSIPECSIKSCGHVDDIPMGPWSDEFGAPFQDGYRTKRNKNCRFHYVVNLQAGHK